jgi:hypothetical protein
MESSVELIESTNATTYYHSCNNMEGQYNSGYMPINNIEDYSDQALQEIAKQICRVVRKEFYIQINFKQALDSMLADVRDTVV